MSQVARVLLPLPLPEAFDYAVPEGMALAVGDQVAAPLGPRLVRGVVVELREARGVNRPLKDLAGKLDDPPMPPSAVAFVEWAARYACEPAGDALAIALRGLRSPPPKPETALVATGSSPARPTAARRSVLEAAGAKPWKASALAAAAGVSTGVVKALVDEGVRARVEIPEPVKPLPDLSRATPALNPSQAAAATASR